MWIRDGRNKSPRHTFTHKCTHAARTGVRTRQPQFLCGYFRAALIARTMQIFPCFLCQLAVDPLQLCAFVAATFQRSSRHCILWLHTIERNAQCTVIGTTWWTQQQQKQQQCASSMHMIAFHDAMCQQPHTQIHLFFFCFIELSLTRRAMPLCALIAAFSKLVRCARFLRSR